MQDGLGTVQSLLVLGPTSDIARATLRQLVTTHTRDVILAARFPERLDDVEAELYQLGAANVERARFEATDLEGHGAFVNDVFSRVGDLDLVIVAFGVLGDQQAAARESSTAAEIVRVNYLGAVSVLVPIAERLAAQGHGIIVGLSSVAGERARASNFVYGSSKAGLDSFLQGLSDRLAGSGVQVLIVRPGFVHTKMTEGMEPAPLATTAEDVAKAIAEGIVTRRRVVWVPPTLRYVMSVLRHLPQPVFRRLDL
jgi:decaprenylphospho-beta-D-erythro-pentofuranosid-2-ulose 2-reductase